MSRLCAGDARGEERAFGAEVRFLVDAHLPRGLCVLLNRQGHDAIHTLDLPAKNVTPDGAINQMSLNQRRIVISKDSDFFYSHLLQGRPWKLLLIKTGNISRRDLIDLFERNLPAIEAALKSHSLLEIDRIAVRPVA